MIQILGEYLIFDSGEAMSPSISEEFDLWCFFDDTTVKKVLSLFMLLVHFSVQIL